MTTRGPGRRSFRRGSKRPTTWFNQGVDLQTLAGSTSLTSDLMPAVLLPEGYVSGYTILRLLLRLTYAATVVTDVVNALFALYVATRQSLTTPPNLNADLLDYYVFTGLQATTTGVVQSLTVPLDIRTKRRIRGEDRTVFLRVTNNEVTAMQIGVEARLLLTRS